MFENTKKVAKKMLHDIHVALKITDISFQILFLGYYVLSMFTYLENKPIFYLYLALSVLAFIWLIVTIFTPITMPKEKKKKFKLVKRIFKYIKWFIRFVVIIFSFIYAAKYNEGLYRYAIIIISLLLLIGQIVFELICKAIINYYRLLYHSISEDAEAFINDKKMSIPGKVITSVFHLKDKVKAFSSHDEADEKVVKEYNDIIDEDDYID